MTWVYYATLVKTKFEASCLVARIESGPSWLAGQLPRYVGIFETSRGRYGVKFLIG